jgi:tetratricopeptide (TPR) repeat protein
MSLQSGLDAFNQGRYQEAIELLEEFSRNCVDEISPGYLNAQMWLLKAYQATGKIEKARELCQQLMSSDNLEIRTWAEKAYPSLPQPLKTPSPSDRAPTANVNLAMKGIGGSLALASGVTLTLLFGMVFVLGLALVFIISSDAPVNGLAMH